MKDRRIPGFAMLVALLAAAIMVMAVLAPTALGLASSQGEVEATPIPLPGMEGQVTPMPTPTRAAVTVFDGLASPLQSPLITPMP